MQRPLFAVAIAALAAIATFGGIAFVWAAPHPHKAASRSEGDWRILDPVVYENIAIFPVVSGSSQDTSSFLTLEEGLASGEVIVSERGATRMVRNRDGVRTTPDYTIFFLMIRRPPRSTLLPYTTLFRTRRRLTIRPRRTPPTRNSLRHSKQA